MILQVGSHCIPLIVGGSYFFYITARRPYRHLSITPSTHHERARGLYERVLGVSPETSKQNPKPYTLNSLTKSDTSRSKNRSSWIPGLCEAQARRSPARAEQDHVGVWRHSSYWALEFHTLILLFLKEPLWNKRLYFFLPGCFKA